MREGTLGIFKLCDAAPHILEERWPRAKKIESDLFSTVTTIMNDVKCGGDSALIDFAEKFDGIKRSTYTVKVEKEEIKRAYDNVSEAQISALEFTRNKIKNSETDLLSRLSFENRNSGIQIRRTFRSLRSVGCYVPGGNASYPSTLLMTVVPAVVAGVPRIVVCTPPKHDSSINPLTLVAADICDIDEIYRIGGAQAIAALVYGTETIQPVEKVIGPGNKYVDTAKMIARSQNVSIDLPAGPSEILILADDSADPHTIVLDMISQAEHADDAVSMLITNSSKVAEEVVSEIRNVLSSQQITERAFESLTNNGAILTCKRIEEAISFINEFGPEHLEIRTSNLSEVSEKITSAGIVLLGEYTPVAASDYCLGTNHVLPTGGYSRIFSGLSVYDFVKRISIVECSREGLLRIKDNIGVMANSEGLPNHAAAVKGRFRKR